MASRSRTLEAGCCSRNPSGADRLSHGAPSNFWNGPLDSDVVDVPDANVTLDHGMEYLAEQRELAFVLQAASQLWGPAAAS